jgi:hypothetical protein
LIKLRIIHSVLCQFGINLLKLKNIIYIPWFLKCFFKYKNFASNNKINYIFPILGEHKEKSSLVLKHYFNQDLLVASYVYKNNPKKHVDVGSRIDGFVAHVASFRKIEVFDIRHNYFQFNNITFVHCKGHSDNVGNNIADKLANEAMDDLQRKLTRELYEKIESISV